MDCAEHEGTICYSSWAICAKKFASQNGFALDEKAVEFVDQEQDALDAIANEAKEYIQKREPDLSTATEWAADDPEDYDQQERPSIAKITNETRRVVPDVEKPSEPVVVPMPEMADVINVFKKTIKSKGKIAIAIDDDLSDASAKIIAIFDERKGALNVIYAKLQDWLDSRGNT